MKRLTILAIVMISINTAFANASQDLAKKIKDIQSMSANFTQKLIDGENDNNVNSKGFMSLKKPQYFKWVTTTPNNQEIISNGRSLWIYDGDLEQLIKKPVSNNIAEFPYLILLSENSNNIDKLFTVKEKTPNNYILKPKDDQMINNIVIKFDDKNELKDLEISTSLNQFTQIQFTNVKTNIDLDNTSFDFKVPKGTDIIDETKS